MLNCYVAPDHADAIKAVPISVVNVKDYPQWLQAQSAFHQAWLNTTQFKVEAGSIRLLPDQNGQVQRVICCIADVGNGWHVGSLPLVLPEGVYQLEVSAERYHNYALIWGLGAYQFTRYKKALRQPARLILLPEAKDEISNIVESIYLVRDYINTPTDDMGPSELAFAAEQLANQYNAQFSQIVGEDLLDLNYPCIYTVGRASDDAPRLVDIRWGNPNHPKITLVGKGVCFDTGGLDIKTAPYMLLMKKDMGGAAHVLGLARMIMEAKLPVSLRVLIPMVENSIAGNAYRPGDIIKSRKGLTIEIGNTDAEGRVILADALAEAASEKPELLIDMSTLTGAARIAVGTDLAAMFSNQDALAADILQCGKQVEDPIWQLPLFAPYREYLNSTIADINNNASEGYGGAISAALFLKEFVSDDIPWLHFDIMAWNLKPKPGKPQGGEAMGLRAIFKYLQGKYAS